MIGEGPCAPASLLTCDPPLPRSARPGGGCVCWLYPHQRIWYIQLVRVSPVVRVGGRGVCQSVRGTGLATRSSQAEVLTFAYCGSLGKLPYLRASVSLAVKGHVGIGSFLNIIALGDQLTFLSEGV